MKQETHSAPHNQWHSYILSKVFADTHTHTHILLLSDCLIECLDSWRCVTIKGGSFKFLLILRCAADKHSE